jgi:hypothetical protein
MPITLNHSNIGVQYNTGSNYIIETVKSDLYLSNEIYDTIVRNNIQTAPVTPSIYIENSSGNVYAIESYTYTGSANTADYTRVFTKNTTCDILIVGGGGGGGVGGDNGRGGGGGGAGQFLLKTNYILNAGTYNIKTGGGGLGGNITTQSGETGKNSSISTLSNTILLESSGGGGGARGISGNVSNGLNGASGGGACGDNSVNSGVGGTALTQFVNNNTLYTGYNGANGGPAYNGGGGGGYTSAGYAATSTSGGDGGSGITNSITGIVNYYCAGGGGGAYNNGITTGTRGGNGGNITAGNGGKFPGSNGGDAINGSGSGGGGGGPSNPGGGTFLGGNGGSGIVIIRYLVGTIPSNNLLTAEPTVISPTFTESIRTFAHSGGTETQTSHAITVGQNTICDILMIGGGGGGGADRAGGGGSGALILSIGNILSAGTYTIRVGNGGTGAPPGSVNGINGFDSQIVNSGGDVIFRAKGGGGGGTLVNVGNDGGSGGGASSQNGGLGGNAVSTNIVGGITTGPVITTTYGVYGNRGGRNITPYTHPNFDNLDGAGGGGIGEGGSTSGSLQIVDSQFITNNGGKGGDGLYFATINGVVYNFKNDFNVNGIQDGTTGNYFIGGGGGGGDTNAGIAGIGGKGGGGKGGELDENGVSASGFGSGGGGAGGRSSGGISQKIGGNGSAGIVIIKFKSTTAIPEGNPITHKRLNFAHDPPPSITYDFTPYNTRATWLAYAASIPNFTTSTLDYIQDPFDPDTVFWSSTNVGWVQLVLPSTHNFFTITYGLGTQAIEPVRLLINGVIKSTLSTINSTTTYSQAYTAGDVVRIEETLSTMSANFIFQFTNTNSQIYTLNFPVLTLADINNNSNIVLRGAYDISLSTMNSSIIPKSGQYIPKLLPLTTSNISIRYNLLNPVLDPIGAQWTYNSSNTNVYHMGNVGIGTKSPEYHLDVRGSIYSSLGGYTQTGLTTWSIASDRRIKENIVKASYDKCLENVKNIELYNFNFKDDCVNTNDKHQLGFIAQEVQQIYPKAVEVGKMILNTNETIDDLLSLNTTQIDYTLYGAVKNLIEKIEDIDNELGNIERNI